MAQADYTYAVIKQFIKPTIILIVDLDTGKKSVTNDIENVVDEIRGFEDVDGTVRIIYRDSDGLWDEFNWNKKNFMSLDKDGSNILNTTLDNFYQFFINN